MTNDNATDIPESILTLGEIKSSAVNTWLDYQSLGYKIEHVTELIRYSTDPTLFESDNSEPASWAPIHAWRALGQLRAVEAAEPLTALFHEQASNEWVFREIPLIFTLFGPKALPTLESYLDDPDHSEDGKSVAIECISKIGQAYPTSKDEVISTLEHHLRKYREQSPYINSCLIFELSNLKSADSWWIMKQVFESGRYEKDISGNETIVQIKLGLKKPEQLPFLNTSLSSSTQKRRQTILNNSPATDQKNKDKKKRKQASKSRQRNRK